MKREIDIETIKYGLEETNKPRDRTGLVAIFAESERAGRLVLYRFEFNSSHDQAYIRVAKPNLKSGTTFFIAMTTSLPLTRAEATVDADLHMIIDKDQITEEDIITNLPAFLQNNWPKLSLLTVEVHPDVTSPLELRKLASQTR